MADEGEPRRAIATGFGTIAFCPYALDDMPIRLDTNSLEDDQRDSRAAAAAFALNNGVNERLGGAFRPRFRSFLRREQPTVLTPNPASVKIQ